jgi:hypothetical protein
LHKDSGSHSLEPALFLGYTEQFRSRYFGELLMAVGQSGPNRKHAKEPQMRYLRLTYYLVLLIAGITSASPGQSSDSSNSKHISVASIEASPADVQTLDGIMKAYYETGSGPAGQPRQWGRDRTLFIPGIRLVVILDDASGKRVVRQFTYQEFVDFADPGMVRNGLYEHEIHRITYRYGDWAHIISTSEATRTPNGKAIGHGIDTVEVFWDGKRWWIVNASITVERPDQPLPKELLP